MTQSAKKSKINPALSMSQIIAKTKIIMVRELIIESNDIMLYGTEKRAIGIFKVLGGPDCNPGLHI